VKGRWWFRKVWNSSSNIVTPRSATRIVAVTGPLNNRKHCRIHIPQYIIHPEIHCCHNYQRSEWLSLGIGRCHSGASMPPRSVSSPDDAVFMASKFSKDWSSLPSSHGTRPQSLVYITLRGLGQTLQQGTGLGVTLLPLYRVTIPDTVGARNVQLIRSMNVVCGIGMICHGCVHLHLVLWDGDGNKLNDDR
jgi:hypothetical protein